MKGAGPKAAFDALEAKLPSIKGRRFYGSIRLLKDGEEYFACVERHASEDPVRLGLELATIPGGRYVRRKVFNWMKVVEEGRMKQISEEFARGHSLDDSRPSLEFYRSMSELHILLPLADSQSSLRK